MWTVVWSSRPALSAIWRKMPLAPRVVRRPPRLLSRLCAHCEAVLKFVRILLEAFRFAPVDTTVAPAVVQCRATGPGGPFRTYSGRPPTRTVPLLPPIDQWGALPLPLQRLSPHSLSRRTGDLLAGDLGAHRDLPVDPDPETLVTAPETPPAITPAPGSSYDAVDAAAAWDRRRRELEDLAGIIDVLTDVERRADELNRRAAELVEGWLEGMRWPRSLRWPSVLRTACRLPTSEINNRQ